MAKSSSFTSPRGMRDFYPEEMKLRRAIFSAFEQSAAAFGFQNYDACVVETLDLLKRKSGEEIVDQIYTFEDKSGRELALRPEMTPTLARMVAARQNSLMMPAKWYTIAQCFRYERMTRGRKREHYQWNMDIIGESSVSAEAELIAAAVYAMKLMGLSSDMVRVHFSSRELLSELLFNLGINKEHHAAAFLALDKRGKITDEAITDILREEGLDQSAVDQVFNMLSVSSLEEAADIAGKDSPALKSINTFMQLLDAYGIADSVTFDISVVRGLSYYTGIVFEGFDASREFRAIFGGGRYDNLLSDVGGKPATGVGLGFGDVVIAELINSLNCLPSSYKEEVTAVGFMNDDQIITAAKVSAALRKHGVKVSMSLKAEKPKSFFSRADRQECTKALYIGPDDIESGILKVKCMADRSAEEIVLKELIDPS